MKTRSRSLPALFAALLVMPLPTVVSAGAAPTSQPTASVRIDNFKFSPQNLTITAGTTVTWVNGDDVPHTVTAKGDTPAFDSKAMDTDDKFSFTFTKPGTYEYYCRVHTHMTGVVVVK